jgi:FAD-dependent urate hydroxylase
VNYLKSFCFGADISSPTRGSAFADYNIPRGLETFEPCTIRDFAAYGLWFQKKNVGWVEPFEVARVSKTYNGFEIVLSNGERVVAANVVVATGLSHFATIPPVLDSLPDQLVTHTSKITASPRLKDRTLPLLGPANRRLRQPPC